MNDRRVGLLLLSVGLLGSALVRAPIVASEVGISWPDEIYQGLEPAHRAIYGYGMVAWEFLDGARNWTFPGFVTAALWALRTAGLDRPEGYLLGLRVLFSLLSLLTAVGVYRLARALSATPPGAAVAAAMYALCVPVLYFGHRAMAETASALPVAFAFAALAQAASSGRRTRDLVVAGALLSIAVLLRLQNAIFCLGALGWVAAWRDRRALVTLGATLFAGALVFGVTDWIAWGEPFHSAIVYVRFNVIEGKSSGFGRSPFPYYFRTLFTSMPSVLPALIAFWALALSGPRAQRPWWVFGTAFGFVLVHSLIPHKEYRFVMPALPLLFAGAAIGIDQAAAFTGLARPGEAARAPATSNRIAVWALGLLCAALPILWLPKLTFGQLGGYLKERPEARAWDDAGPVNRLLIVAGERPDLCGLKTEAAHLAWTGGHSYLHRNVPLYSYDGPSRESGAFNYVIAQRGAVAAEPVAEDGPLALYRLPWDGCIGRARYDWRLP